MRVVAPESIPSGEDAVRGRALRLVESGGDPGPEPTRLELRPAARRPRRRVFHAAAAGQPRLDPDQLVALLSPAPRPAQRGRWLLFAIALHAAAVLALALAAAQPRLEPERIVRVHLLPAAEESGPGSPAAAALPEPPVPAPDPPKPAPPPRVAKPAPTPKPERPVVAPAPAPLAAQPAETAPPEAAPAEVGSGAGEAGAAASGSAHASANGAIGSSRNGKGGLEGLDPAYVRRFLASLDRHKEYPRSARARRLEGTTLLWMRMDRSGQVLASRVEKSSGHSVLDRAVLQAVRNANPLPALPASDARAQVELEVPIAFRMR